jgi:hypothetical protein
MQMPKSQARADQSALKRSRAAKARANVSAATSSPSTEPSWRAAKR